MCARTTSPILRAAFAAAIATLAWSSIAVPESVAGKSPTGVVNRRGYPKLAILRSSGAPTDPTMVEALYRNWALADMIVFQGNRGKWWTLPRDASGFSLRDYNRLVKILEYFSLDAFPTTPPTGNEIVPPPTDPEAALHTSNFTREEFYALARAVGSTSTFPVLPDLDPKWTGVIQRTESRYGYATWVVANWKSRVFREYVKATMAQVAAAGFNGVFFDFGALAYLTVDHGFWIVMPPDCFRLKVTSQWYWMSMPGEYFAQYGPPPDLGALRALDPAAVDAIQDVDYCGLTGIPAEVTSEEDIEAMILDFYREMRASSRLLMIYNGAGNGPRYRLALVNTHGSHEEGFGLRQWTPAQVREELDMVDYSNTHKKIFIGWIREQDTAGQIYSYAECLVAGGPLSYCEFSEQIPNVPEIMRDPGKPVGHYVTLPTGETDLNKVIYKRRFSNALVYLNPTDADIAVDGITIDAKSGLVLPPVDLKKSIRP